MDALGARPDPVGGVDVSGTLAGAAPLDSADHEDLSFCGAYLSNAHERLRACRASMLIVDAPILETMPLQALSATVVRSETARLDFIRMLRRFFVPPPPRPSVHATAVIASSAQIGEAVTIGPLCTVADDVVIGSGSVLHAGVHLYPGVRIGARVTIHSGTVIGPDGYGYERNAAGELERFPHLGGVVIEDDVEIGPNVAIARGTLGNTRIGARARIDNLVHISHNVCIEADAAIVAHAMLCGSSSVGEGAWIGPCATLREGISVGAGAVVGTAAVVTRPVGDGVTVVGNPARKMPSLVPASPGERL
jgi:UDP-3-O-[3-hydroxymyristoyl] glucosamine N-acyltransferase